MTNEWVCAHCHQPQSKPSQYTVPGVGDFCSQECMDAHADSLTSYFDKRMQVFEGMRAEASADEFATVITNERGTPIAIREPLGELEALRAENARLREALKPFAATWQMWDALQLEDGYYSFEYFFSARIDWNSVARYHKIANEVLNNV